MAAPSGAEPTASTFKEPEMSENTYGEDERPAASGMSDAARLQPEKPKSFKEAFAEARSAGDKNFTWQGKKYTTALATNKSAVSSKDLADANKSSDPLGALVRAKRFTDVGSEEDQRSRGLNRAASGSDTDMRARGLKRAPSGSDVDMRARGFKGYASGGSVKGSGCEQRGLRKCKVV
jgi:hypothetical protein